MGKTRAELNELLEDGLRQAKAGLLRQALRCYAQVRARTTDDVLLAEAWRLESHAHRDRGAWELALEAARMSLAAARRLEREDLVAEALNAEAAVHFSRGDFDQALPLYEKMLDLAREPRVRGLALQNVGIIHARRGELDQAERRLDDALDQFELADYEWGKAHVLNNRVAIALDRQAYERAATLGGEAVRLARAIDDLDLLAIATLNAAEALMGLGRLDEAENLTSTALGQFEVAGNRWRRISCLRLMGDIQARQGEPALARAFWERALELARELGATVDAAQLEERLAR